MLLRVGLKNVALLNGFVRKNELIWDFGSGSWGPLPDFAYNTIKS